MSTNAISALERGERRRPYPHTIRALTQALGLTREENDRLVGLARGEPRQPEAIGSPGHRRSQPAHLPRWAGPDPRQLPVPRQLPAAVAGFTGRHADLARLDAMLLADDPVTAGHPPPVVISAIGGTAGVGKTALAVTWAHRVRAHFPDGQLYVNLRGYDSGPPVSPEEVLDGFLRALDVPIEKIPPTVEQRAALFRSVVDGRRVLLLLDNAYHPEQVRPLLPGTPTSMTVVTSRSRLTGLSVSAGAIHFDLDLLPVAEAVTLLERCVGEDRAAAEPEAVIELVRLCARLPLALRLAGHHAAARPERSLADLVAELGDENRRLDFLSRGTDEATAIRAVFTWSYRRLPGPQARMFRLLGLHPGPDLDVPAAAALAGCPLAEARPLLDDLVETHLVNSGGADRFRMHDLLRAFAKDRAEPVEAAEALARLVGHFLHNLVAAGRSLDPNRLVLLPPGDEVANGAVPVAVSGYDDAMRWCERERHNLIALTRTAAQVGLDRAAWQLAFALGSYLNLRRDWTAWITVYQVGLSAAERSGDQRGTGHMLNNLAIGYATVRRSTEAVDALRRALALFTRGHDAPGAARTRVNLADTLLTVGQYGEAIEHCHEALKVYRTLENPYSQSVALGTSGEAHLGLGNYREALSIFEEVLRLCQRAQHRPGESRTHVHLGEACLGLRRYRAAIGHLTRALELCDAGEDWHVKALALRNLGRVYRVTGDLGNARQYWREAMEIFEQQGDPAADELRGLLLDHAPVEKPDEAG